MGYLMTVYVFWSILCDHFNLLQAQATRCLIFIVRGGVVKTEQYATGGFIYGLYSIINRQVETNAFFVPIGYYIW